MLVVMFFVVLLFGVVFVIVSEFDERIGIGEWFVFEVVGVASSSAPRDADFGGGWRGAEVVFFVVGLFVVCNGVVDCWFEIEGF